MATFDDMELERKLTVYDKGFDEDFRRTASTSPARATSAARAISNDEPLRIECEHFVECVRDGAQPRSDGRVAACAWCACWRRCRRSLDGARRSRAGR